MSTPEMCYRQDYLTMVLLRVDFPAALLGVEERARFSVTIAEKFPHASSTPLREMTVNITDAGNEFAHRDLGHQWTYRKSTAGTICLTLSQESMTLTYGPADYTGFTSFLEEFSFALKAAADAFSIKQFTRIGLRYINEVRLPGRALEWDGIIANHLLSSVMAMALPDGRLQRSMHQVSELHDEDQILLNYGLVNPDYPSALVQRHFILDVDCSRQSVVNYDETIACVQRLNSLCSATFERSIDQELRNIMEIKNG